MKILFLPNWDVHQLKKDDTSIQSPDKQVEGEPYWFFRYFPEGTEVDIIDRQKSFLFHKIESKYLKFYIYQSFKAFFCRKKYDVVISHGAQSGLFYSLLNRFKGKKHRPLHVIIDVGGMNGGRTNQLEIAFIKAALKSQPAIIYHASIQKEMYKKIYSKQIIQSQFIPFGVNVKEFAPLQNRPENYVLSFGYAKRDYPTLINAWKLLNTDTILRIVGDPSIESDHNILISPKANIFQLKDLISKCLFVVIPLPVFNYAYGQMSFLQSMAMGKPVVVTRTSSSTDYLEDGSGSFFVNPYDEKDLKMKLESLLKNKDQLPLLGQKARAFIETNLTERKMGEAIYNFVKESLRLKP